VRLRTDSLQKKPRLRCKLDSANKKIQPTLRHFAVSSYQWLSGRMSAEFNVGRTEQVFDQSADIKARSSAVNSTQLIAHCSVSCDNFCPNSGGCDRKFNSLF
jgi:hypothetical protein